MIQQILDKYFAVVHPPLNHTSPYTLLIAVLLSAQCTDERVNKVTTHLFKLADTAEKMITLEIDTILSIIKSCGLGPTKAKAIYSLSQILVDKYNHQVPKTINELTSLPGVGHKTASVVLCQAFNIPAFPVDTHILRAAKRWNLSNKKTPDGVEKDLKAYFPKESWIKVHLQIIYFCRKYCPARAHKIQDCPICKLIKS